MIAWRCQDGARNHKNATLCSRPRGTMPRSAPRLPRASWHARARCRACRARSASGLARSRAHASCVPRMVCACSVQCRAFVDGAECCSVQSHGSMLCIVGVRASCGRRRASAGGAWGGLLTEGGVGVECGEERRRDGPGVESGAGRQNLQARGQSRDGCTPAAPRPHHLAHPRAAVRQRGE